MMAALAVVGAILMGCAGEDMANEAPQAKSGNKVIQTTTISLGSSAGTRALDADGKKTFAVGDQIAIFYKNTSNELQLANSAALTANDISSDGKTATITVEMTDPKPESQLRYIYPAAMGRTDIEPAEEIEKTINYEKLSNDQDGTLETLASTCDLAVYDGKLTSNGGLPGSATLKNLLAIAEFTFKDYTGQKDITSLITSLTIKQMQGDNRLTINRTAAAGPIYVAMSPCSDEDISIIATDGTNSYEKTATAKSLAANTMTPVTMKMQKVVDLSKLTADYEAQDGDILTETLGTNVKISIADGAEIALRGMAINGIDNESYQWAGITCLGDATIILQDGTTNTVKGFQNKYPGIFVPENKTLTIKGETEGTGSLNASSNRDGAGIGGGYVISCGNIDIQGGKITATGGESGAGIGGGPLASCGNITISGGTIEATSQVGTGIGSGGGGGGPDPTSCGNITISGGTVKATNIFVGAGIGCGYMANCGNITITGGTVEATGQDGAGIGSSNGGDSSCGDITISGGTVKATSKSNGAGIGSGDKCGIITISGGTVEATGGYHSAGIGGGSPLINTCGTITITTGVTKVTATKGEDAPYSIGRGHSGGSTCGTVTFGTAQVFNGTAWSPSTMVAGSYGGLNLAISTTTTTDDTWTLTPVGIPWSINGLFSVSATKKVVFSKGNLRCMKSGESWAWSFFSNQYDYYNAYNENNWDKFCWVGASGALNSEPDKWGISTSMANSDFGTNADDKLKSDWGDRIGTGWRTLTNDEWTYLLKTRDGATSKYGFATVNDVYGIIILPDVFVDPGKNMNEDTDDFVGKATNNYGYNKNVYKSAGWADMEAAGAVFLPAAGDRLGVDFYYAGTEGYYWSSTAAPTSDFGNAYGIAFGENSLSIGNNKFSRYYGLSVRLVRDAN